MQMNLSVQLQTLEDGRIISSRALLDSGSTGLCMSRKFVEKHQIPTTKLARPIPIYNADGTLNKGGKIEEYVERIQFTVSDLGEADVFIRYKWLKKHNPDVDWRASSLFFTRCPDECMQLYHTVQ